MELFDRSTTVLTVLSGFPCLFHNRHFKSSCAYFFIGNRFFKELGSDSKDNGRAHEGAVAKQGEGGWHKGDLVRTQRYFKVTVP